MQAPWGEAILTGKKTIESRSYPLPECLLNQVIWIIDSPEGEVKKSALPDSVPAEDFDLKMTGYVIFDKSWVYPSLSAFNKDFKKHLVPCSSGYAWTKERPIYAW